jgi:hypothetical protein
LDKFEKDLPFQSKDDVINLARFATYIEKNFPDDARFAPLVSTIDRVTGKWHREVEPDGKDK